MNIDEIKNQKEVKRKIRILTSYGWDEEMIYQQLLIDYGYIKFADERIFEVLKPFDPLKVFKRFASALIPTFEAIGIAQSLIGGMKNKKKR